MRYTVTLTREATMEATFEIEAPPGEVEPDLIALAEREAQRRLGDLSWTPVAVAGESDYDGIGVQPAGG